MVGGGTLLEELWSPDSIPGRCSLKQRIFKEPTRSVEALSLPNIADRLAQFLLVFGKNLGP